jgi:hypothetical protein
VRDLVEMLLHLAGRNSNRAGQFLIRLSPRLRISRIDKGELLAPIQPLANLVNCDSGCFHNMEYATAERHSYHEANKFVSQAGEKCSVRPAINLEVFNKAGQCWTTSTDITKTRFLFVANPLPNADDRLAYPIAKQAVDSP